MRTILLGTKKGIRKTIFLVDLLTPILLYGLLNSGKHFLSTVLFITIILIRIIYVTIL